MRKLLLIAGGILLLESFNAGFATAGEFFDRLGDRIDRRLDRRGDAINDRLDR